MPANTASVSTTLPADAVLEKKTGESLEAETVSNVEQEADMNNLTNYQQVLLGKLSGIVEPKIITQLENVKAAVSAENVPLVDDFEAIVNTLSFKYLDILCDFENYCCTLAKMEEEPKRRATIYALVSREFIVAIKRMQKEMNFVLQTYCFDEFEECMKKGVDLKVMKKLALFFGKYAKYREMANTTAKSDEKLTRKIMSCLWNSRALLLLVQVYAAAEEFSSDSLLKQMKAKGFNSLMSRGLIRILTESTYAKIAKPLIEFKNFMIGDCEKSTSFYASELGNFSILLLEAELIPFIPSLKQVEITENPSTNAKLFQEMYLQLLEAPIAIHEKFTSYVECAKIDISLMKERSTVTPADPGASVMMGASVMLKPSTDNSADDVNPLLEISKFLENFEKYYNASSRNIKVIEECHKVASQANSSRLLSLCYINPIYEFYSRALEEINTRKAALGESTGDSRSPDASEEIQQFWDYMEPVSVIRELKDEDEIDKHLLHLDWKIHKPLVLRKLAYHRNDGIKGTIAWRFYEECKSLGIDPKSKYTSLLEFGSEKLLLGMVEYQVLNSVMEKLKEFESLDYDYSLHEVLKEDYSKELSVVKERIRSFKSKEISNVPLMTLSNLKVKLVRRFIFGKSFENPFSLEGLSKNATTLNLQQDKNEMEGATNEKDQSTSPNESFTTDGSATLKQNQDTEARIPPKDESKKDDGGSAEFTIIVTIPVRTTPSQQ